MWGGWKVAQRHGGWTGVLQVRAGGDSRLQGGRRQPAIRTERKRRHTPQGLAAAGAHHSPCPPCCHTAGAPPAPEPPRSACGAVAGRQYKQYRQSEAKAASGASSVLKTCCRWGKAAKQRQIGFATLPATARSPTHLAVPMVESAGMPPAKGSPAAASFFASWEQTTEWSRLGTLLRTTPSTSAGVMGGSGGRGWAGKQADEREMAAPAAQRRRSTGRQAGRQAVQKPAPRRQSTTGSQNQGTAQNTHRHAPPAGPAC